jgi:hypothetical protein
MIDFKPLDPANKEQYDGYLQTDEERGCEYSFVNLYLWGRQKAAFLHDHLVFFSQFNRKSVYLFPVGNGDKKAVLDALMEDAQKRGIPCRFTGLTQDDCALLERLYPGKFRYHFDRDTFDYIYAIDDLAELKGRKFQRKRNHLNRFRTANPDHTLEPITRENLPRVRELVEQWYTLRLEENPHGDYHMERAAITKAMDHFEELGMEGLLLRLNGEPVAMTMGSRLNEDTVDVHFEKALDIADGAYAAINNGFACYLREKYPQVRWLNREDDMGLEGLRKAKLSYNPDHMVEKSWAHLLEDGYDY